MNQLDQYNFRDLLNKYIYIHNQDVLPILANYFEAPEEATGLLAYCSLDHKQGLELAVRCCAYFNEASKSLKLYSTSDTQIGLPYASMRASEALILPEASLPLDKFAHALQPILTRTEVSEGVQKSRSIVAMDHLRNQENPDAVLVQLVHGDDHIEGHYVLVENVGEMNLTGTLLSEPEFDFGVHQGESISFFLVRNEKGIMCLAML